MQQELAAGSRSALKGCTGFATKRKSSKGVKFLSAPASQETSPEDVVGESFVPDSTQHLPVQDHVHLRLNQDSRPAKDGFTQFVLATLSRHTFPCQLCREEFHAAPWRSQKSIPLLTTMVATCGSCQQQESCHLDANINMRLPYLVDANASYSDPIASPIRV